MLLPQVSQVEEGNTNPSSPTQSSQNTKPRTLSVENGVLHFSMCQMPQKNLYFQ